jgi:hypothetical protein
VKPAVRGVRQVRPPRRHGPPPGRRPAPGAAARPATAAEAQPSGESLCGHRNLGGRSCTRELDHVKNGTKSHRYG